ncbi:MAG: M15 family metallopeptidase [Candidatus Paceibacterota bacterium]
MKKDIKIANYSDLKPIKVIESAEKMVNISQLLKDCICVYLPQSNDMINYVGNDLWLRESVALKIERISIQLRLKYPTYRLKIVYGYRHLEIQTKRFYLRRDKLKESNPEMNEEDLLELANTMVANPETAGHPTGGAVDLTITTPDGDLDMGTEYADFSMPEEIKMYCPHLTETQKSNRKLLCDLMITEEFAPFYGEWWHYSYGDREWAWFYNKPNAIYSQIEFRNIF